MLRIRQLFRMAEESVVKKLKPSPPLIGTHKYAMRLVTLLSCVDVLQWN